MIIYTPLEAMYEAGQDAVKMWDKAEAHKPSDAPKVMVKHVPYLVTSLLNQPK